MLRKHHCRVSLQGFCLIVAALLLFFTPPARADQVNGGPIASVIPSWMPSYVLFSHSALPNLNCPNHPIGSYNGYLQYNNADPNSVKAMYAAVLAAYLSGKSVFVVYDPGTCLVTNLRLI